MEIAKDDSAERVSQEPEVVSGVKAKSAVERVSQEPEVVSGVTVTVTPRCVSREPGVVASIAPEEAADAASVEQSDGRVPSSEAGCDSEPDSADALTKARQLAQAAATAVRRFTRSVLKALSISELQAAGVVPFKVVGKQLLKSYGQVQQAQPTVMEPGSIDELAIFFGNLRRQKRNGETRMPYCTFRAGGQSFDEQSLNNEVVLLLSKLKVDIVVHPEAQTVEVSGGANWGQVVAATLKHKLVPHVVVTTSQATAAGTLASDGICRHSPIYGSESGHVEWLELLTPIDDKPRRLHKPARDDHSDDAELFRAVIGGFGYLGVITRICYRLLSVKDVEGPEEAPVRVKTRLKSVQGFGEMVDTQLDWTAAQATLRKDETTPANLLSLHDWEAIAKASKAHKAVYSIAFLGSDEDWDGQGAVYESWYERTHDYQPYLVYNRRKWWRFLLELAASVSWIRRIGIKFFWQDLSKSSDRGTVFVNEVEDYLFFMDANRAAKTFMERRLGRDMPVIQQTYVVPPAKTADFLVAAALLMKQLRGDQGISPTLFDVLFMPRDDILMSASNGQEGFACSIAFEDIRTPDKRAAVEQLLRRISSLCFQHGGRVHFTKHVYADPADLCAMYRDRAEQFMLLKERYDPDGILHNGFFERVFINACPHDGELADQ